MKKLVLNALFLILFECCGVVSPLAFAETSISGVGALNLSSINGSNGGVNGGYIPGLGGGLLFRFGLFSFMDMELGGLYLNRNTSGASTPAIEVPILFRFNIFSIMSLGMGGYYSSQGSAPLNLQNYDYGLECVLGFSFPLSSGVDFLLDGRYLYGLNNVAVTGSANYQDIQELIGLKIWLGSGNSRSSY